MLLLVHWAVVPAASQPEPDQTNHTPLEQEVTELMRKGDIPGLSIVMITGDKQIIRTFGYADVTNNQPVTDSTLFEIGSCSKAFTALAIARLEHQGKISLDAYVTDYLPWLSVRYKKKEAKITIGQLLHHTSGIPWSTIAKIPQLSGEDALLLTVRQLVGQELKHAPGKKFEYATINYDVLALVIERITNQPFETYLREQVMVPLGMHQTTAGVPVREELKAKGYKIGFFRPIAYKAPVFRGNNAAGYVHTNANDMAIWLKFQMGLAHPEQYFLARSTHQRDETVPLHDMSSYAQGWEVSLSGNGEIYHGGLNPNYTAYIAFLTKQKVGVAVMANSNSTYTEIIGDRILKRLSGGEKPKAFDPGDRNDKTFSVLSFLLAGYILLVAFYLGKIMVDLGNRKRKYVRLSPSRAGKFALQVTLGLPFLYGIYVFPEALVGFNWEAIMVWTPASFRVLVYLLLTAMAISYLNMLVGQCFPEKDKYRDVTPKLIGVSILSGIANVVVIILLTSSQDTDVEVKYLLLYYTLTIGTYLVGRRYVQINLIKYSRELTYELRIKLIDKMLSTSYQKFEKIDRGRVYTALNDDVDTVGESTDTFVMLVTHVFTTIGIFTYLMFIAFWASVLVISLIVAIGVLYYLVVKSTNIYFEQARDTRNEFMRQVNEMIDGFKEISLHLNKKLQYKKEVEDNAAVYKDKISTAGIRFVNAFLIGESFLVILLGTVAFGFPILFPEIESYTIVSFIIVILYLIGPINGILGSVPIVMRLKIAWERIQQFLAEIPANLTLDQLQPAKVSKVENLKVEGVRFSYTDSGNSTFAVGPIDLEVHRGEVLFIVGGNGSGKTTLAKMLTGLYAPDEGRILLNGQTLSPVELGEYYSTVFSTPYIFNKLYNVDLKNRAERVHHYLQLLELEDKVKIVDQRYSTINLSGGQRKRLALLQCYIEDAPIYLFDEWAADQDPEYRHFFYRELLPEMKKAGKIIIAITHDDHYFDVADQVLKMNRGEQELTVKHSKNTHAEAPVS
jgi:cyclic peptide transporter